MAFAILSEQQTKPRSWLRLTLIASIAVHLLALLVAVVDSLWQVDEMPLPSFDVTLTAAVPPPPPPPPPKGGKKSESKPKTTATEPDRADPDPSETKTPEPEPALEDTSRDEGEAEGEEGGEVGGIVGGEVGGVQGGVVGGVLGGTVPKPVTDGPQLLSPQIARGQLLIDPNQRPYRVEIPEALAREGVKFSPVVRLCVTAQGAVYDVKVLQPAGAAIDSQIPTVMRRWRYRPYLQDGRARAFCYVFRYDVTVH